MATIGEIAEWERMTGRAYPQPGESTHPMANTSIAKFYDKAFYTTPEQKMGLINWSHIAGLSLLGGAIAMETLPVAYSGIRGAMALTTAGGAAAAGTAATTTTTAGLGTAAAVGVSGASMAAMTIGTQAIKTGGTLGLGAMALDYMQKNPLVVLGIAGILGFLLLRRK